MTIVFRSILWTRPLAPRRSQFKVDIDTTLRELEREVHLLGSGNGPAQDIVIGAGYRPGDLRVDGRPRADAREPIHPGVEISFDSRHGRLTYATAVFDDWRDNVRAVALGLEALRSIDRWGVAQAGQQYAGFALLSAGPGLEELGRQLVERFGSVNAALRATHPDTGLPDMTPRDLQAVQAYRDAQRLAAG